MGTDGMEAGLQMKGYYPSLKEIQKKAPRVVDSVVATDNASYCFDGKDWVIVAMKQYIKFRVVSRHHIVGRGYATVIHNPDQLPIDWKRSAVVQGQYRLPIRGIERSMTLMTIPEPKGDWALLTSEQTSGDYLTVRMYPDQEDEHVKMEE